MTSPFIGRERLRCMENTVPRRLRRSYMRSSPGNGWGGTPTPLKKRSTSSPAPANCTWKTVRSMKLARSVFAIATPVKHDLVNVGDETLRAVAFFAAAMFTQNFDNVMMPPKSHILGTPNREG